MSQMTSNTTQRLAPRKRKISTNAMLKVAVLTALAVVLQALEFKVPFTPPWLSFDLSDLPAMLGGMTLGPGYAVLIELLKNLLKFTTKGTLTMGVGELANFVTGCALCVPVAFLYQKKKSLRAVLAGMAIGVVSFCVLGAVLNITVLMPLYMSAFGGDTVLSMAMQINPAWNSINRIVALGVTPFNLMKGVVVSVATALLYKLIAPLLLRESQRKQAEK